MTHADNLEHDPLGTRPGYCADPLSHCLGSSLQWPKRYCRLRRLPLVHHPTRWWPWFRVSCHHIFLLHIELLTDNSTEELATRIGDAWGGLLNATFGNAVELLIAILALVKGDIDIVQASMAGSILSNSESQLSLLRNAHS